MVRLSPARAHLQRMAAAAADAPELAPAQTSAASHEHQLLLAQLYEHRKTLKGIQSVERKIEAKVAMVPVYDAYIDGALKREGDAVDTADPIIGTLMVWNIDAGRYDRALQIAYHVLCWHIQLPDQYHRDPATLLMDEFSTAALAGKLPEDPAEAARLLLTVIQYTTALDAPDQARAKLHKAMGYVITGKARGQEPDYDDMPTEVAQAAYGHLWRAHDLFGQVGVKKDLERLERRLKKAGIDIGTPSRADPRPGGSVGNGTGEQSPTA